jgi:hypothetical protein
MSKVTTKRQVRPDSRAAKYAHAQVAITRAAGLLHAAALAVAAAPEDADTRSAALTLIRRAKGTIKSDALDFAESGDEAACEVESEVFRLYSLICVAAHACKINPGEINDDMVTAPAADALKLAAEMAGTEHDEGLAGRLDRLILAAYRTEDLPRRTEVRS